VHKNHDRLKGDQAKKYERIEKKGIDAYTIRNCARFWFFTNNRNATRVEGGARRTHTMKSVADMLTT